MNKTDRGIVRQLRRSNSVLENNFMSGLIFMVNGRNQRTAGNYPLEEGTILN